MQILENLKWRYATKRMTGEKVGQEILDQILTSIQLSPSSVGLQPYKILVIESDAIKNQLRDATFNQPQIIESSHLLVFTVWDSLTDEQSEEYIEHIIRERGVGRETLKTLDGYLNNIKKMSKDEFYQWASKQAFLALGVALLAAAEAKVDSTPMEGFNKTELDKVLNLDKSNLKSVVLMAIGYRDLNNDWLLKMKKVRWTKEKLFVKI